MSPMLLPDVRDDAQLALFKARLGYAERLRTKGEYEQAALYEMIAYSAFTDAD